MRLLGVAVAVLLSLAPPLALSHPVAAHGDGIGHGAVFNGTLFPGERVTRHLDFEDGPLIADWVFMIGARVQGESLTVDLSTGDNVVASWTIAPTTGVVHTMTIPQTGSYNLTFRDEGTASTTYWAYFDQSCNCLGKFIPAEIPTGMVIFNTDTRGPTSLFAQFNEPNAMKVRVTAALRTDPRGQWPSDFRTLAVSNAPVQRQVEDAPPVWLHEFNLEVPEATRVYFFVHGVVLLSPSPSSVDLLITPYYEAKARSSFLPLLLIAGAAVFAVAGGVLLWRVRRPREVAEKPKSKTTRRARGQKGRNGRKVSPRRDAARGGRRTRTSRHRQRGR